MKRNRVRELWAQQRPVAVGWCSTVDPYTSEAMLRADFDALILDMQHGMGIDNRQLVSWLQFVGQTDTTPVVRIPWNAPEYSQFALDAGAQGIIIPMVNDPEAARTAVGACRYPPVGYRSFGPNRAWLLEPDYFAKANEDVICLVMLETQGAVEQIEAIAATPGCDGFFIGPMDLGVSMGLPPAIDHTDERHPAAIKRVAEFAAAHGRRRFLRLAGRVAAPLRAGLQLQSHPGRRVAPGQ